MRTAQLVTNKALEPEKSTQTMQINRGAPWTLPKKTDSTRIGVDSSGGTQFRAGNRYSLVTSCACRFWRVHPQHVWGFLWVSLESHQKSGHQLPKNDKLPFVTSFLG